MAHGVFVTVISCMDGRVQEPVSAWMRQRFHADYVDTITEPGPEALLAGSDSATIDSIRRRTEISVRAHGSRVVAVVAHHDCAGNPVSREQHLVHLERAAVRVQSWRLPAKVVQLWVNEAWRVEPVSDAG